MKPKPSKDKLHKVLLDLAEPLPALARPSKIQHKFVKDFKPTFVAKEENSVEDFDDSSVSTISQFQVGLGICYLVCYLLCLFV